MSTHRGSTPRVFHAVYVVRDRGTARSTKYWGAYRREPDAERVAAGLRRAGAEALVLPVLETDPIIQGAG
jgi:hypothetical protein